MKREIIFCRIGIPQDGRTYTREDAVELVDNVNHLSANAPPITIRTASYYGRLCRGGARIDGDDVIVVIEDGT
jgi:hypothetical protein